MKRLFFFLVLCGIQINAEAQMGKTYHEVQIQFGEVNLPGLNLRTEGDMLVEDKKTGEHEVRMLMYNKDSVVVGIGVGRLDTSITTWVYLDLLKNELPLFKMNRSVYHNGCLHQWDTVHQYLIIYGPSQQGKVFPNTSLVMVSDPSIIRSFIGRIDDWKD